MIKRLINKNNPIDEDYIPEDLVYTDNNENNFHNYYDPTLKPCVIREVYEFFCKLQESASKEGLSIVIDNGYRSYDYQTLIFDRISEEKGLDYAFSYVALPGTSEHQSGLAIDVAYYKDGVFRDSIDEESKEYMWMINNAHKYGFILRYPKGKEEITGYSFEPWHFRYVGVDLAQELHDNNLTLEEYYLNRGASLIKKHK